MSQNILLELSPEEVTILEEALELWKTQPHQSGLMGSVFSAMLGPKDRTKEEYTTELRREQARATEEVKAREIRTIRLRLKLLEAQQRPSEFSR